MLSHLLHLKALFLLKPTVLDTNTCFFFFWVWSPVGLPFEETVDDVWEVSAATGGLSSTIAFNVMFGLSVESGGSSVSTLCGFLLPPYASLQVVS